MSELRYTLLSDGSSDRALIPVLTWLLRQHLDRNCAIQATWADLRRLPRPPKLLAGRIEKALDLYPCDLLFIHRDAEGQSHHFRMGEIRNALAEVEEPETATVPVVPVRMQEAWLLFDESALRRAAGNPNGKMALDLPSRANLERLPDPKKELWQLLRAASGLKGRRLARFLPGSSAIRVAEFIDDFHLLRGLSAFQSLEHELEDTSRRRNWK